MDELLKLKRKLAIENNNNNVKRGDMDPTEVDYSLLEDKIDDKVPKRGDIVTRNKRSDDYDGDDDDDDYYYEDDDDLWGFGENDGLDLINEEYANLDQPAMEFRKKETIEVPKVREEELERKLRDYIARNRPINLRNRKVDRKEHEAMLRRLNELPVAAKIVIDQPKFQSRNDFERDVDFPEINPSHKGIQVKNFPVSRRPSHPKKPPPEACVWAIVQCCPRSGSKDVDRQVVACFEYMACPGVANWNSDLCRGPFASAARAEIIKT
ncbi:Protein of unknown function [Cotesia congregata]|uniref:Uncharacterized protein n=1 Tax=Cotesia congregata TaxID=51543 RepID=A0A8J2H439_COTCN|nr:Protein of unknown function [Cotesia congregata]